MSADAPRGTHAERAVLITGCSSGIGKATATHLARSGFLVFATVRREAHAVELGKLGEPNLVPICPLDLTTLGDVPHVAQTVGAELDRRDLAGLFALIHNAGGGGVAPIELIDLDRFRTELQTRLLGAIALIQAFLPLLRRAGGRIVWIMTPATIPTPYVASIHACDFAANCLARTLEIELKRWRIPNVMIRCGGIRTERGLKTTDEVEHGLRTWPQDRAVLYDEALRQWGGEMAAFDAKRTDPTAVADVVARALRARRPKRRYSAGHMASAAAFLELLPQRWVDAILKARF